MSETISGTRPERVEPGGIQVSGIIEDIERAGKPVITSNQAPFWHCLRTLGVTDRPTGFGGLLAGNFDKGASLF
ncbi:hypothetical protein CS8_038420 [Cupriavidus sp. 8B]